MIRSLSLSSVFLLACACSSADPTLDHDTSSAGDENSEASASSPDAPSTAPSEQVLNELRFEDLEISFIWSGSVDSPEGSLAIDERFRVDYVGALRAQFGSLTSLELFNAFAPEGMEPHPLLVARHEGEARAYGRSGDGLGLRDIDARTLTIDKSIPVNCQSTILPSISPGSYTEIQSTTATDDSRFVYTCVGSPKVTGINNAVSDPTPCERHLADTELTVGICNDSTSTQLVDFWSRSVTVLHQLSTSRGSVLPNTVARFTVPPDPNPIAGSRGLAVLGRNIFNPANVHRQVTGLGVYP